MKYTIADNVLLQKIENHYINFMVQGIHQDSDDIKFMVMNTSKTDMLKVKRYLELSDDNLSERNQRDKAVIYDAYDAVKAIASCFELMYHDTPGNQELNTILAFIHSMAHDLEKLIRNAAPELVID